LIYSSKGILMLYNKQALSLIVLMAGSAINADDGQTPRWKKLAKQYKKEIIGVVGVFGLGMAYKFYSSASSRQAVSESSSLNPFEEQIEAQRQALQRFKENVISSAETPRQAVNRNTISGRAYANDGNSSDSRAGVYSSETKCSDDNNNLTNGIKNLSLTTGTSAFQVDSSFSTSRDNLEEGLLNEEEAAQLLKRYDLGEQQDILRQFEAKSPSGSSESSMLSSSISSSSTSSFSSSRDEEEKRQSARAVWRQSVQNSPRLVALLRENHLDINTLPQPCLSTNELTEQMKQMRMRAEARENQQAKK
jgi:hypothetical protein